MQVPSEVISMLIAMLRSLVASTLNMYHLKYAPKQLSLLYRKIGIISTPCI